VGVPPEAVTVALPLLLPQVALVVVVDAVRAQAEQDGNEARLEIVNVVPNSSVTRIG
jgi:hypothetical protein